MTTATPRPVPGPPKPAPPPSPRADRSDSGRPDPGRIEEPSLTGAQALVRSLEALGVEVMFGIPGGAILPAYDPLFDSRGPAHPGPPRAGRRPRRHRLRPGHRQGRRLHGHLRPGRDEPGHADRRRVHGLGADGRDHRPGGAAAIGTDAFQEADIQGITLPITKHNYLVQRAEEMPRVDGRGVPPGRRPAAPARCWSTSPRTCCRRRPSSPGRPSWTCPATGRRRSRTASRSARRPG